MINSWLSLVPPIVVLVLGFLTQRVLFSLICGIFSAALIAKNFALYDSIHMIFRKLWVNIELYKLANWSTFWTSWNAFICIFLFILAILVTLIAYSGGAHACANFARRHIKDARGVQTSSLLLSTFFFIDDYFSSLTVGSVMHPLTDHFKVPRVKLAFLVDAMAAPLAVLCPISSWFAAITGFLTENGISLQPGPQTLVLADPLSVYIRILPFLFYSFIIIGSVWFIVRYRISYGSMNKQETIAETTGNLFGGKESVKQRVRAAAVRNQKTASIIDFVFPVITLFISVIVGMLFSGEFYLLGGNRSFFGALQHSNAAITLFVGGILALGIISAFFLMRDKIRINEMPILYWDGIKLMAPAIAILILAWTLGDILRDDLLTGQYLASLIVGSVPIALLPAMFFVACLATSFAIGSSWGTIAIFLPIALPMLLALLNLKTPAHIADLSLLFPLLGAIFSGAVAGDHISPISDTTVMSSTSTGSHHIDHVQTQITYTLPVIFATTIAYVITGLLAAYGPFISALTATVIGLASGIMIFSILNIINNRNPHESQ